MSAPLPRTLWPAESRRQLRVFLCTNFVYVWLVFGSSLTLYPLGIDYLYLADSSQMQDAVRAVWNMEMRVFGDSIFLYRMFNVLVFYCCMVCILFLTRFVLDGPWWLGSLAAVLTMANPAKSDGVLQLSAVADLLPAFSALAALAMWACWHRHGGWAPYAAALVLGVFASLEFMENVMLPWVMLALYVLIPSGRDVRMWQLLPVSAVGIASFFTHGWVYGQRDFPLVDALSPLYLAFYPLGLWPATATIYLQHPWLWLVVAALFGCVVFLLWKLTREGAVLFAVAGAFAFRLVPLGAFDFVHLRGGGALIVPMALMYMGFSALWMHVQRHPRWRRQAVMLTTLLCLVFFGLQWQALWHWRHAGAVVKAFQSRAAMAVEESGGEPVAIAPDFRFHQSAPVALYASVLSDTLFSVAQPATTCLAMNYFPPPKGDLRIISWDQLAAELEISGCTVEEAFGPEAHILREGGHIEYELYVLTLLSQEADVMRLKVRPLQDFFPQIVVPLRNRGDALALQVDALP